MSSSIFSFGDWAKVTAAYNKHKGKSGKVVAVYRDSSSNSAFLRIAQSNKVVPAFNKNGKKYDRHVDSFWIPESFCERSHAEAWDAPPAPELSARSPPLLDTETGIPVDDVAVLDHKIFVYINKDLTFNINTKDYLRHIGPKDPEKIKVIKLVGKNTTIRFWKITSYSWKSEGTVPFYIRVR